VAYGFAPYAFAHGEHHLDLTFYWHVPLGLLVTRWLSVGEGLSMRGAKFLFAIAVGYVTGLQNQYYTFMFIQLAALGGLAQWVRRGWRAFLPALGLRVEHVGLSGSESGRDRFSIPARPQSRRHSAKLRAYGILCVEAG
jgi:hypothetical protein